jgi:hypothetical protein
LSAFFDLERISRHISTDIYDRIGGNTMIARLTSDELDAQFRLVRTL